MVHTDADDTIARVSTSLAVNAPSSARDWSYVETWLSGKFAPGAPLPAFERNPATLQATLDIIAANEAADGLSSLRARADAATLASLNRSLEAQQQGASLGIGDYEAISDAGLLRRTLIMHIENNMTQDGKIALEALAGASIYSAAANADTHSVGSAYLAVQNSALQTSQLAARVDSLNTHLQSERRKNLHYITSLRSCLNDLDADLAQKNLNLERKVAIAAERVSRGGTGTPAADPNSAPAHLIKRAVIEEEEEFLQLLDRKKRLEAEVASFAGLSAEPKMAKNKSQVISARLDGITSRRNEGLDRRR